MILTVKDVTQFRIDHFCTWITRNSIYEKYIYISRSFKKR